MLGMREARDAGTARLQKPGKQHLFTQPSQLDLFLRTGIRLVLRTDDDCVSICLHLSANHTSMSVLTRITVKRNLSRYRDSTTSTFLPVMIVFGHNSTELSAFGPVCCRGTPAMP